MGRRYSWSIATSTASTYFTAINLFGLQDRGASPVYCTVAVDAVNYTDDVLPFDFDVTKTLIGYSNEDDRTAGVNALFTVSLDVETGSVVTVTDQNSAFVLGTLTIAEQTTQTLLFTISPQALLVGIEDILQYVEAKGNTIPELNGKVKTVRPTEAVPDFKDYGMRVYFGENNWLNTRREKIGPILTDRYMVNIDLVFNRSLKYREVFSDTKGISYWETVLKVLFANNTNQGLFRDSYWSVNTQLEQNAESVIIKGILNVVVDNPLLQA